MLCLVVRDTLLVQIVLMLSMKIIIIGEGIVQSIVPGSKQLSCVSITTFPNSFIK